MNRMKTKLIAGAGAVFAAAGGGVAIAATQLSPAEENKAIVADAAKQLGVDPTKLNDALEQALENRIDARVKDGTLTEAQATQLKARIAAGDVPLFASPRGGDRDGRHGGRGFGQHLDAAATYLGVTPAALRTQLEAGKTLADVAKAQGKTVAGVVAALVADEKKELDAAVAAGKLTAAQRDQLLTGVEARITAMVNGERPAGGPKGFGRPGEKPSGDGPSSSWGGEQSDAPAAA